MKISIQRAGTGLCLCLALLGLGSLGGVAAVTIVECQDAEGQRFLSQRCPPGTVQVGEKKVRGAGSPAADPDVAKAAAEYPVKLYTIKACDSCDLARNYLKQRGVPFSEHDAAEPEVQQELQEAVGSLSVPVILVGAETINGYSRSALKVHLDAAGYPDPEADPEATGAPAAEAPSP